MPGSRLGAVIAEIRRRHVVRVASVYAVVAWAVVQVAATVQPYLRLPSWVVTALIVTAIAGFPLTLVLAWLFDVTPTGIERTEVAGPAHGAAESTAALRSDSAMAGAAGRLTRVSGRRSLWFVAGAALALLVAWAAADRLHPTSASMNEATVAILPFRVSADPSLAYLREGMVDLLAAKLTGEQGPRALDSRSTLAAWRGQVQDEKQDLPLDGELRLARHLGAGQFLEGEVIGTPGRLTLSARIVGASGAQRARAEVVGSADSLPGLVDRLTGELLVQATGEPGDRLERLSSTPLPALRAYLEGQAALRHAGTPDKAVIAFQRALQIDSTFTLAALGLVVAAGGVAGKPVPTDRAYRLIRAGAGRLGPADRDFALSLVSLNQDTYRNPPAADIRTWEKLVGEIPDKPDVWDILGSLYFQTGPLAGISDSAERARAAFEREVALEPTAWTYEDLLWIDGFLGDTARLRSAAERAFRLAPGLRLASVNGWVVAVELHDDQALTWMRANLDRFPDTDLWAIPMYAEQDGLPLDDAERALELIDSRAVTAADRWGSLTEWMTLLSAEGRRAEMDRMFRARRAEEPEPGAAARTRAVAGLFLDPPDTVGEAELVLAVASRARSGDGPRNHLLSACALEHRHLLRGDAIGAAGVVARLQRALAPSDSAVAAQVGLRLCAASAEALRAAVTHSPDATARLQALDSALVASPLSEWIEVANFTAARLHAARGENAVALAAVRRRARNSRYLAPMLREEARLAARVGDRAGAVKAYRDYLVFRSNPDPGPETEQTETARSELADLARETR